MGTILALLCLIGGSPDDANAEGFDRTQEPKAERYRVLLSELATSNEVATIKAPIDLPEGLKEAIEDWTRNEG